MNLLQTIIPVFLDLNEEEIKGVHSLATAIAIEICLLGWFIINFISNRHGTIKERLFFDGYDFPNGPTAFLIGFNAFILFLFLVVLITKLIE